jgi:2-polyprenyl-3-methyl-5-hydroxy-6-metoxy-1,4-benzoquinol methylase
MLGEIKYRDKTIKLSRCAQNEIIAKHVKNRNVLDIGCVGQLELSDDQNWLHGFLYEHAKSVLGVDLSETGVATLKEKGYNVIHGNAETFALTNKFDVVIFGGTLQEISNQGLALDNIYNHLKGGELILTNANAACWWKIKDMIFNVQHRLDDIAHSLHDIGTLIHLLNRHKFQIEHVYYYHSTRSFLCRVFPVLSDSIMLIAKKAK